MSVIVCVCANEMEKEITMRLRVFGAFDREEREREQCCKALAHIRVRELLCEACVCWCDSR